jgi:hypothetical protein
MPLIRKHRGQRNHGCVGKPPHPVGSHSRLPFQELNLLLITQASSSWFQKITQRNAMSNLQQGQCALKPSVKAAPSQYRVYPMKNRWPHASVPHESESQTLKIPNSVGETMFVCESHTKNRPGFSVEAADGTWSLLEESMRFPNSYRPSGTWNIAMFYAYSKRKLSANHVGLHQSIVWWGLTCKHAGSHQKSIPKLYLNLRYWDTTINMFANPTVMEDGFIRVSRHQGSWGIFPGACPLGRHWWEAEWGPWGPALLGMARLTYFESLGWLGGYNELLGL